MKLVVNNQTIQKMKDDFPHLSRTKYKKENNDEPLRAYFNDCEKNLKSIMSIEKQKYDEDVQNYDFFNDILDYSLIILNDEDLDKYLKELFNTNYKLQVIKTLIPVKKYSIQEQETISNLKNIVVAVKDNIDLDLEHVYTVDDIMLLQNQNLIRFLAYGSDYQKISSIEYSKLNKQYMNSNIVPIKNGSIDKYNYLKLMSNYPYLFTFIRNNIDFTMVSELLYEYETLLSGVVNKEVDECNKKVDESLKRIDDIKKLTLHF